MSCIGKPTLKTGRISKKAYLFIYYWRINTEIEKISFFIFVVELGSSKH